MSNYDEDNHYFRFTQLFNGHVMSDFRWPKNSLIASKFSTDKVRADDNGEILTGDFPLIAYPLTALDFASVRNLSRVRLDDQKSSAVHTTYRTGFDTLLTYLPYLPAAWLYPFYKTQPLFLMYAYRLTGMVISSLLIFLSLKLMPAGRWALGLAMLMPVAIMFRSKISGDPMAVECALLMMAYVMHLRQAATPITKRAIAWLALISLGICFSKVAYLLIPCVIFLIPRTLFPTRAHYLSAIAAAAVVPALLGMAWSGIVVHELYHLDLNAVASQESASEVPPIWKDNNHTLNPALRLRKLFTEPQDFLSLQIAGVSDPFFWQSLDISMQPFTDNDMRGYVAFSYFALALIPLLFVWETYSAGANRITLSLRERLLIVGLIFATVQIMMMLLYVQFTPDGYIFVKGLQGRYLWPLAPLFLLALLPGAYNSAPEHSQRGLLLICAFCTLATLGTLTWHLAHLFTWDFIAAWWNA